MTEIIGEAIKNNAFLIISYTFIITLITIIVIMDKVKKRNKYMRLKKQTINLILWSKEWEMSEDDFLKQLIDDNERLENRVKVCERELNKMSLKNLILVILALFALWIKKDKKNNKTVEKQK